MLKNLNEFLLEDLNNYLLIILFLIIYVYLIIDQENIS